MNLKPIAWAASVLTVVAIALFLLFHFGAIGSIGQEKLVDRSGSATLVKLTELKQYHAASGYYEVVIDQEKDVSWVPSWAAGERILFVAAGSVDVVVDFSALDAGAISVSEDRTAATIRLPRATLATPALDVQRSYTVRDSKGLRERFGSSGELGNQVYRKGSEQILAAANRDGQLRTLGETSTRNMLEGLLGQLGFTDVTVTFVVGKGN